MRRLVFLPIGLIALPGFGALSLGDAQGHMPLHGRNTA